MNNNYYPDNWVVLKLTSEQYGTVYKILAGWSGGYLDGDSWRLNSGIVRHEFDGDYWYFYGSSGSCYKCYVDGYGLRFNNAGVWNQLQERYGDKVELLDDQAWIKADWDWIISE